MEQKYYDAYRKDILKSFKDVIETTVNNPKVQVFGEAMLGTFVAKDIGITSKVWKKNYGDFASEFKKHGKKFMTQQEWDQFVDSVAMEIRDEYLKF